MFVASRITFFIVALLLIINTIVAASAHQEEENDDLALSSSSSSTPPATNDILKSVCDPVKLPNGSFVPLTQPSLFYGIFPSLVNANQNMMKNTSFSFSLCHLSGFGGACAFSASYIASNNCKKDDSSSSSSFVHFNESKPVTNYSTSAKSVTFTFQNGDNDDEAVVYCGCSLASSSSASASNQLSIPSKSFKVENISQSSPSSSSSKRFIFHVSSVGCCVNDTKTNDDDNSSGLLSRKQIAGIVGGVLALVFILFGVALYRFYFRDYDANKKRNNEIKKIKPTGQLQRRLLLPSKGDERQQQTQITSINDDDDDENVDGMNSADRISSTNFSDMNNEERRKKMQKYLTRRASKLDAEGDDPDTGVAIGNDEIFNNSSNGTKTAASASASSSSTASKASNTELAEVPISPRIHHEQIMASQRRFEQEQRDSRMATSQTKEQIMRKLERFVREPDESAELVVHEVVASDREEMKHESVELNHLMVCEKILKLERIILMSSSNNSNNNNSNDVPSAIVSGTGTDEHEQKSAQIITKNKRRAAILRLVAQVFLASRRVIRGKTLALHLCRVLVSIFIVNGVVVSNNTDEEKDNNKNNNNQQSLLSDDSAIVCDEELFVETQRFIEETLGVIYTKLCPKDKEVGNNDDDNDGENDDDDDDDSNRLLRKEENKPSNTSFDSADDDEPFLVSLGKMVVASSKKNKHKKNATDDQHQQVLNPSTDYDFIYGKLAHRILKNKLDLVSVQEQIRITTREELQAIDKRLADVAASMNSSKIMSTGDDKNRVKKMRESVQVTLSALLSEIAELSSKVDGEES